MSGRGPNDVRQRGQQRGAGGRGELHLRRRGRRWGCPRAGGRWPARGWASRPCALRTMPVPVATAEARHLVDAEHLERGGRPDDVDDGVVPTDLVEVHLVDGAAVQGGLDRGQRAEDRQGPRRDPGGQGGSSMRAAITPWVRTTTSSPPTRARVQAMPPRMPSSNSRCQPGRARRSSSARTSSTSAPGVDERAQGHVARDAGEAVEPGHASRRPSPCCVTGAAGRWRRPPRSRCRCRRR